MTRERGRESASHAGNGRGVVEETDGEREPTFLYIGTSKAGSTWLYAVLAEHPEVYVEPGKGLYFFSDQYHRGLGWYRRHFQGARAETAVGEMSHNYLYSREAPDRIAALNPRMKLLACLREPVDRAFSDYLHRVRNGELDMRFEEALEAVPSLVERGRYAEPVERYIERFGRELVHVAVFDDLRSAPDRFVNGIFDFLEVEPRPLPPGLREKIMPAGRPRLPAAAQAAKRVARAGKRVGLRGVVGAAKRSRAVRNLLYRPYAAEERPTPSAETRAALRSAFAPDVRRLDRLLGTDFRGLWGY